MGFIQFVIDNPVKISAGVIVIVLFGFLSIFSIPVQLTPDVDEPRITVLTRWTGASPQEIENEIIDRQEEKLKSVSGLKKMTSSSKRGEGVVVLEFHVGVDKDDALRDTIEKINQVSSYPEEVDRPEVVAADAALESPIAWLILRSYDAEDVSTLRDFVEDEVKPMLERVPGVASTDIYGGREREVQVLVDPARMAARGITFRQLEAALRSQNRNVSAGTTALGKREYTYRTVGEFRSVEEVEQTVVAYQEGGPVLVGAVAEVVMTNKKQYSFVKSLGEYVMALPVRRETGANVIATMDALRDQIARVNREILSHRRIEMQLTQVYDETTYINASIGLVIDNIIVGGALATAVLLLFLRSVSATMIVACTIPISVIGAFLVVAALGRSLNVIMLAGMAFAVGMVVDNAIVVLENTFRHRQLGLGRAAAALKGAAEVWGAILASTLTTVAVFLPIVFVEEEAGQLFADIAIAITSAVILSLIAAITVIPAIAARALGDVARKHSDDEAAGRFGRGVAAVVDWTNRSSLRRLSVVIGLTAASIAGSWLLTPPAAYLPSGNRNLVFGFLDVAPGYSIDEFRRISEVIEAQIRPYWEAELDSPEAAALPPVPMVVQEGDKQVEVHVPPPPIENFFFVAFDGAAIMGCTSKDEARVRPLVNVFNRAGATLPGANMFFQQTALFGRSLGANTVELELRSGDEQSLDRAAGAMFGKLMQAYGYPRPTPTNFDVGRPELQAVVNRVKAADVGLNVTDLAFTVESCINGAYVGGFRDKGDEIDLVIKVKGYDNAAVGQIATIPIYTPSGDIIPIGSVVSFERKFEPQEIAHSESMRSITFNVSPPSSVPLEAAIDDIMDNCVAPLRESGMISPDVVISMAGNADKLVQTRRALIGDYTGLFQSPAIASLPPWATLSLLAAAGVVIGAFVWLRSPRWGLITVGSSVSAAVVLLLFLNPLLALELLQSRGCLALLVTFLLMAALFESFIYSLVIMLSVPPAALGGFAGLAVVHSVSLRDPVGPVQQLDVLTMLGFIILVGIVVNNAILIVHQALNNIRDSGMDPHRAIVASVRTRVRPIFMTALTTIGGMMPLVIMPGSGSELYRGLGAVMSGGLLLSTIFTLVLVPAMFSLFLQLRIWLRHALRVSERIAPHQTEFAGALGDGTGRTEPTAATAGVASRT